MRKSVRNAAVALVLWSLACAVARLAMSVIGTGNPTYRLWERESVHRTVVACIAVAYPTGAALLTLVELSRSWRERGRR